MPESVPQVLLEFLARFNCAEFWESHEVLEVPWRENRSEFYKGLILFASAFVHVQRGNPRGILAQLGKAERHLEGYRPTYLGVNVDALLTHSVRCREIVARSAEPGVAWADLIPRIRIEAARELVRGDEPELSGTASKEAQATTNRGDS
jgi:hypothetical protein